MGRAYAAMLEKAKPTIRQILDIKQDKDIRLTISPFGLTPEQYATNPPVYLGKSAPWKGLKGLGIEGFAKALIAGTGLHGKISMENRNKLITGLRKAISISQQAGDKKFLGTVLFQGKLYPLKCIEQKRIAGKIA